MHDSALSAELTANLDLTPEDRRRAEFTILAFSRGWNKARIGRYLGVSRARVHQRIERYQRYTDEQPENWPVLSSYLIDAEAPHPTEPWWHIGLTRKDWQDADFAGAMVGYVDH